MRIFAAVVSMAVWLCSIPVASADGQAEEPASGRDEARESFEEGLRLFEAGRVEEAAAAFRKAYDRRPNWKLLYNIGQSEASAKRYGLAAEAFERYMAEGGDEIPAKRQDEVLTELDRLRRLVGMIQVVAPAGRIVTVDGIDRGVAPLAGPLLVAAGMEHRVGVRVGEEPVSEKVVRVPGGQTLEIALEAPSIPDETDGSGSTLSTLGWVGIGLGGALLAGSIVTGAMALSLEGDLESDCPDQACPEDRWEDVDSMETLGTTTDVLLGVGAAIAAAGAVLLIVDATDEEETEGEVAVVPAAGPGFAGAAISGRF